MSRFNERTTVSREALLQYAGTLRRMAEVHELVAKLMQDTEIESIDPTHVKTGVGGLAGIARFMGAAVSAYCDNANAKNVAEIAGASVELQRLTSRLAKDSGVKKAASKKSGKQSEPDPGDETAPETGETVEQGIERKTRGKSGKGRGAKSASE